jgi:hypothetical protein
MATSVNIFYLVLSIARLFHLDVWLAEKELEASEIAAFRR